MMTCSMMVTDNFWGTSDSPSLVIFDLDGTLVDSLEDLSSSVNFMRGKFGLTPLLPEVVRRSIGKGARNLVTRTMPEHDARIDEALAIFLADNGAHLAAHTRLYPGARELLSALNRSDIPLALVSNKNTAHCRELIDLLGIADFFHTVLGGDAVEHCKPSPQPLLKAVALAGAQAVTSVMVGDSSNDFEAARGAGMRSIGCMFGYGEPWELDMADIRINALNNLLPLPW